MLVAQRETQTNARLLEAASALGFHAELLPPGGAPGQLRHGDLVLGRIDVRPGLDGVEPGLWALRRLEREPASILNNPGALLTCHDKLATALTLSRAGLPHPQTALIDRASAPAPFDSPVVVKPRFGSWGRDVTLCASEEELRECLQRSRELPWFQRHGALVQELVLPVGRDLRVVVSCGRVVGAVERVAAPGDWRTNVALGATRHRVRPPAAACLLAITSAAAVGADLVGVDLLPQAGGGWVVLELNGAVDFTDEYSPHNCDVFRATLRRMCEAAAPARAEILSET